MLISAILCDVEERRTVEMLLWIVLGNEFVQRRETLYRVEVGSGMGQIHSGSLADLAFYQIVEKNLPLNEVALFARFRDHVLVVTSGVDEAKTFFAQAQALGSGSWT